MWSSVPSGRVCRRRTRCGCCGSRNARRNCASCSSGYRTMIRAACPASRALPMTTTTGRQRRSGHVSQWAGRAWEACEWASRGRQGMGGLRMATYLYQASEGRTPGGVLETCACHLAFSSLSQGGYLTDSSSCGHTQNTRSPFRSGALLCLHQCQQQHVLVLEDHQ